MFRIMQAAFVRAGLVEGKADAGQAVVTCFICEQDTAREHADYDYEFDLWECRACLKKWGR